MWLESPSEVGEPEYIAFCYLNRDHFSTSLTLTNNRWQRQFVTATVTNYNSMTQTKEHKLRKMTGKKNSEEFKPSYRFTNKNDMKKEHTWIHWLWFNGVKFKNHCQNKTRPVIFLFFFFEQTRSGWNFKNRFFVS